MKQSAVQTKTPQALRQKASATSSSVLSTRSAVHPLLQLQRSIGNQGVQRFMQPEFTVTQPGLAQQQGTYLIRTEEKPSYKSPIVPKRAAESPIVPSADEGTSKESVAAAAPGGEEIPGAPATPEKAPARPEEDPAYQAVVGQLEIEAKKERTPTKTPEQKKQETVSAANLPAEVTAKENEYRGDLTQLAAPDLTVEVFMKEFDQTVEKLSKPIPEKQEGPPQGFETWNKKREQAAEELKTTGPTLANQDVTKQNKAYSDPYSTPRVEKIPEQVLKQIQASNSELKMDPVGSTPTLKHASAAAAKAKTDKAVSLDDQSRALDDALVNHNVGGQTINIEEASLAFPVSGEKSFDEAGETKRRAQLEILKAKPRYREQEKEVLTESKGEIHSLVNTTALQSHHAVRAESFKGVLEDQELRKGNIKKEKVTAFSRFEEIYEDTKGKVEGELKKFSPEEIGPILTKILEEAEAYFASTVRTDLEYIYTPGHWGLDYSDWIDESEVEAEIAQKTEELLKEGKDYLVAHHKALVTVQDKFAAKLFAREKEVFIVTVKSKIEDKVAKLVVDALNAARTHIAKGRADVEEAYKNLPDNEKKEAKAVLEAVQGKFQSLEESVVEAQHEVITDMARTYNQSVGKLQSKFDEIKKDVLTSWLEKAWNKIKAVVNAIIDFAKRIMELLARIAGLAADIISSPRAFFRNLAAGISQGFSTFVERIDEFLATAFFDWLRGSSGVMVQLPKEWSPKGIFSLFTQLLNLGTETIWQRMEVVYDKTVANAFRRGEVLLDKGLEIFGIIKNEGLGGLWDHIRESLGNILDDTLEMIKETVLYAAIKKVIFEIGKMLVPGGGFIVIAEKVIRLVQFLVEARNKILDLIESFVASMENAVKGDIAGIVSKITGALTKFITVALDFLVTFFGLGSLKEKVERFIERMRKPIIRGIDWVLEKFKPLVMKGKELVVKGKEKVVSAGKTVVQVGVPEDPNERLRLAARASVSAARRLTGRVTQGLLNPILGGIKLRYGLQALQPYDEGGTWWVRAIINPQINQNLGVPSAAPTTSAAQPPALTEGTILAVNKPTGAVRGVFIGYGREIKYQDGTTDRTVRIRILKEERLFGFKGFDVVWFVPPPSATPPPPITFSSSQFPFIHQNIKTAIAGGHPRRLRYLQDRAKAKANRTAALAGHRPAKAGFSLDEYPFASTYQGGAGARVIEVPEKEQDMQGGVLSTFYQNNRLQDGDEFDVV
jgi:hypothetical protein